MTAPGGWTSYADAARDLAATAHAGQVDKQDRDYHAYHLAPVAALLRPYGDIPEAAGWLHDILEDTPTTLDALAAAGFPIVVRDAVDAVTRRDGETYDALIARAAAHPVGRLVKLADNWVNLTGLDDLARIDPDTAVRLERKYGRAREALTASLAADGDAR